MQRSSPNPLLRFLGWLGAFVMAFNWPSEEYTLAPNDYLAAFGQATLVYNMLESVMSHLFVRVAPLEEDYAFKLFHSLNNRERVDLLSGFVCKNEADQLVADALLHCILCYDLCTQNRNILMHSTYFDMSFHESEASSRLVKRANKDPMRELHFEVPLLELRSVADQITEVFIYVREIYGFIFRREHCARIVPNAPPLLSSALPEKPSKPRVLTALNPSPTRS
jgi:hypothetical protein